MQICGQAKIHMILRVFFFYFFLFCDITSHILSFMTDALRRFSLSQKFMKEDKNCLISWLIIDMLLQNHSPYQL